MRYLHIKGGKMKNVVYIDGYWKDDKSEFSGYACKIGLDSQDDDDYFYYFEDIEEIKNFMKEEGFEAFVVTNVSYLKP